MDLPTEIFLHILKSLEKCDLKSARLVSKTWTAFAAEFLFDQVYVSVHPENLEVFEAITQHALLSKCVKTLIYDAVDFVENYTKDQYICGLWVQTVRYALNCPRPKPYKASYSEPEINTWMMLVEPDPPNSRICNLDEARRACKDYDFVDYGYQKYQRYAALQRSRSKNGHFVESFVRGLQKLQNLSCVIMDDQWPLARQFSSHPKIPSITCPTGSPLARNWNTFHTEPRQWEWMPEDYSPDLVYGATDGADHYWTITCALVRSQRKIQTFKVGYEDYPSIPPYCFDRTQVDSFSFHGLDIAAFSGLKNLKLSIAAYGGQKTPECFPNMDGLRILLGSMPHLEVLYLELPGELGDHPTFYAFNQVFPRQGQWSQLTTLSLKRFATSATDLLNLLVRRMPNMTKLELGVIELLTGSGEGVIECMMQSMHLTSFRIAPYTRLWHHGGIDFWSKQNLKCEEIEEYVKGGGRHPCLRPEEPDSAAQKYVTEDLKCFYKTIS